MLQDGRDDSEQLRSRLMMPHHVHSLSLWIQLLCLQCSIPAGAAPDIISPQLISSGAVTALLRLLQQPSEDGLEAAASAALLLAYILRTHGMAASSKSSSEVVNSSSKSPAPVASKRATGHSTAAGAAVAVPAASPAVELAPDVGRAGKAVPAGAVAVLLGALKGVRDEIVRLAVTAALGQLLRRPTAAAER